MRLHLIPILFVTFAGFAFADEIPDEADAIKKIELLGGKITRDETLPGSPVLGVDFQASKRFNEKYIHLLKSFHGLRSLNLEGLKVSDAGLKQISELRQMFPDLDVCYDDPKESRQIEEIERLGGNVTRYEALPGRPVRSVVLTGRKFRDDKVHLLEAFTVMTDLQISSGGITDNGLATAARIKTLRSVNLSSSSISDVGVKQLIGLTELTQLRLDSCKHITDASLKAIGQLKGLKDLGLGGTQITDAGLRELRDLKSLTNLYLAGTAITDLGLNELSDFKNLTTLDLADTKVTDDGLKFLVRLKSLTTLDLMFCKQITDAGMKELCKIKNLAHIRLEGSNVTDVGVKELQNALPDLRIIR